jgi:hypothetical protein
MIARGIKKEKYMNGSSTQRLSMDASVRALTSILLMAAFSSVQKVETSMSTHRLSQHWH